MAVVQMNSIVEYAQLDVLAGLSGIYREVTTSEVSRPGMELTGHLDHYEKERIQLLGKKEMTYILQLQEQDRQSRFQQLCTSSTPGIIVTRGQSVPHELVEVANKTEVPLIRSVQPTTKLIDDLTRYLETELAPTTSVHGVLLDIYGVGVLVTGKSGIGKSEIALELVKRGHQLVADDRVDIRRTDNDRLIGTSPSLIQHLIEIRGLGIVNVATLFGAGSVLERKDIALIMQLEEWDGKKEYDRLGLDEQTTDIIDVQVPTATIPIRPGRNISVIIEVAAMNFRQKSLGVNAATEFADRLSLMIKEAKNNPMEGR